MYIANRYDSIRSTNRSIAELSGRLRVCDAGFKDFLLDAETLGRINVCLDQIIVQKVKETQKSNEIKAKKSKELLV